MQIRLRLIVSLVTLGLLSSALHQASAQIIPQSPAGFYTIPSFSAPEVMTFSVYSDIPCIVQINVLSTNVLSANAAILPKILAERKIELGGRETKTVTFEYLNQGEEVRVYSHNPDVIVTQSFRDQVLAIKLRHDERVNFWFATLTVK